MIQLSHGQGDDSILFFSFHPPSLSEKKRRFGDLVKDIPSLTSVQAIFDQFLEKHYEAHIQYFTFTELDILINDVITEYKSKPLRIEDLELILERYKNIITNRGDLRKSYNDSLNESRIY